MKKYKYIMFYDLIDKDNRKIGQGYAAIWADKKINDTRELVESEKAIKDVGDNKNVERVLIKNYKYVGREKKSN